MSLMLHFAAVCLTLARYSVRPESINNKCVYCPRQWFPTLLTCVISIRSDYMRDWKRLILSHSEPDK